MACGTCPPEVVAVIRTKVRAELNKLRAIIRMTNFFNDAFGAVASTGFEDVSSAVDAIPVASPLSFLDLLAYATCPLTPLALGLDGIAELVEGDVNAQLKAAQSLGKGNIDRARREYEEVLNNSVNAKLIKQVRKYERQLRQIGFSAQSFAEAVVCTAVVQSVCDQGEFDDVFAEFGQLVSGFSFTGGVPTSLDNNLGAVTQKLSQGEAKFEALRKTLYSSVI